MKGQEHAYEKITDVVEEIDAGAKERIGFYQQLHLLYRSLF